MDLNFPLLRELTPLPPPESGDITYQLDEDTQITFSPSGIRYSSLDPLSRVQLKILAVHLSELQDQIRGRLYRGTSTHPHAPGDPDGPA